MREVRLIGPDGDQLGIVPTDKALATAREHKLDLIEIAPQARPPVCKIASFGKMRYDFTKKQKQMRKNQNIQTTKTIQIKPNIGEADLERKINKIQQFIDKGFRVIVQVTMRGRQKKFSHLAEGNTIDRVKENLVGGQMEKPSRQGGKITAVFTKDPNYTPPEPQPEAEATEQDSAETTSDE